MKRGTPEHPKTKDLCVRLRLPLWGAVGILESLWLFTQKFAVRGDIGKFSDEAIAEAIGWKKDPQKLIRALVDAKWLDGCDCHRLLVHDWKDHCDQTVQRVAAKRGLIIIQHSPSIILASSYDHAIKFQHDASQPLPLPLPLSKAISHSLPPNQIPAMTDDEFDFAGWFEILYALTPKKGLKFQARQAMASDSRFEDPAFRMMFEAAWRRWAEYMAVEFHGKRCLLEWFNDEGWKDEIPKTVSKMDYQLDHMET